MRRAARVDANHSEIVTAFRQAGCDVLSLAKLGQGVPDLLVQYHGRLALVEVKHGQKGSLTDDQRRFSMRWALWLALSVDDVPGILAGMKGTA